MYFEAESNGIKYEMTVREDRKNWIVSLKPEGKDWVQHLIPKTDYQIFDNTINFIYKRTSYLVDVVSKGTEYSVYTRGSFRNLKIYNDEMLLHESLKAGGNLVGAGHLESGMPGKIIKIFVKPGDEVKEGEPLLIMEAMKMENEMRSPKAAKVKSVHVKEGQNIEGGVLLIQFEK